jgi:hypothetical protein
MQSSRRGLVRLLGLVTRPAASSCASVTPGSSSRGLGMNLGSGFSRRFLMSRSEGLDVPRDPHKQVRCAVAQVLVCFNS